MLFLFIIGAIIGAFSLYFFPNVSNTKFALWFSAIFLSVALFLIYVVAP